MPSQKLTPFAPWCPASQCLGTCRVCPWFSNCSASTHTSRHAATRSLACPHIYVMPHQRTFSCTSTHTSCYAPAHSLALPHIHHAMLLHVSRTSGHIRHATLLYILLHFRTTSCHAAARSLAFRHIRTATLPHNRFHFHTYVILRASTARYADGCEA